MMELSVLYIHQYLILNSNTSGLNFEVNSGFFVALQCGNTFTLLHTSTVLINADVP